MPKTTTERRPRKPKKNRSLEVMRAISDQMAKGTRLLFPATQGFSDDDFARPVSGFLSQWMGRDSESGEIVEPLSSNIQRVWESDERRKHGLPPKPRIAPGIVKDTMSLPNLFGNGPEWSQKAEMDANDIHSGVQEGLGLDAPEGFKENALEGLGIMGGQLPVPLSEGKSAVNVGKGALSLMKEYGKKAITSPIEFLSPTVNPKASNYASGALFPGTMGYIGEHVEPIANFVGAALSPEELPLDPRLAGVQVPSKEEEPLRYEDLTFAEFAGGGKVKTVGGLRRVTDAVRSGYPRPGVFSTLDNLIEQAPFNKASPEQWKAYLKPGREYIREGVRFPLRSEELLWGGDPFIKMLNSGEPMPIEKATMLRTLREGRPQFDSSTYGADQSRAIREIIDTADAVGDDPNAPDVQDIHNLASRIGSREEPQYGHRNWRSDEGDNYHEWLTKMRGLNYEQGHFNPNTVSWSRIQHLHQPDIGMTRLVDEIQSDLHQAATQKIPGSNQRIGYADSPETAKSVDDLMYNSMDWIDDEARRLFKNRTGRDEPVNGEDFDLMDQYVQTVQDDISLPIGGQPPKTPFTDEGWIRHELNKNLLEAAESGNDGLAVVNPRNVTTRYANNPGLGKFYEHSVIPELERLAKRYGTEVRQSGVPLHRDMEEVNKKVLGYQDMMGGLQQHAERVHDVINSSSSMKQVDEELYHLANDVLEEFRRKGIDLNSIPSRYRDVIGAFADGSGKRYDPAALRQSFWGAMQSIGDMVESATKQQERSSRPYTMTLTPELREKIKRIGVPLFSTVTGGVMLDSSFEDEDTGDYAEGGKVKNLEGALKLFRGLVGGSQGISERALKGEPRDGYSTFLSSSPHVASSYANPDLKHGQTGAVAPFYVKPEEVIEFPVNKDGTFDKMEFDRRAKRLKPGQVLVARQAYDSGPRASLDTDPEGLFSYRSDIYAMGPNTKMKTGIGEGYAEGGKIGGLKRVSQMLKAVSLNPDASARFRGYAMGDPIEEILQATNAGLSRGVINQVDKEAIKQQIEEGNEEALMESLLRLHEKLNPTPPSLRETIPVQNTALRSDPIVTGELSSEDWDRNVLKQTPKAITRKVKGK